MIARCDKCGVSVPGKQANLREMGWSFRVIPKTFDQLSVCPLCNGWGVGGSLRNMDEPAQPAPWPAPTPEMMASPQFEAVWQVIKTWDVNVPLVYAGYCGANGNHVRAILDALQRVEAQSTSIDDAGSHGSNGVD